MYVASSSLSLTKITPLDEAYCKLFSTVEKLHFCDTQLSNIGRVRDALLNVQDKQHSNINTVQFTEKKIVLDFEKKSTEKRFQWESDQEECENCTKISSSDTDQAELENYSEMNILWSAAKRGQLESYKMEFEIVKDHLFKNNVFFQIIFFYSDKIYSQAHPKLERLVKNGTRILKTCLILEAVALISTVIITLSNYLISIKLNKPIQFDFTYLIYFSLANFILAYFTNVTYLIRMRTEVIHQPKHAQTSLNEDSSLWEYSEDEV